MLGVTALQLGNPMSFLVLMEADNPLRHCEFRCCVRVQSGEPEVVGVSQSSLMKARLRNIVRSKVLLSSEIVLVASPSDWMAWACRRDPYTIRELCLIEHTRFHDHIAPEQILRLPPEATRIYEGGAMKRNILMTGLTALAVILLGCTVREPTIELTASDFDLNPLVGKWHGEYSSDETGRSGDISFTLKAGEVAASGQVLMTPRPAPTAVVSSERPIVRGVAAQTPAQRLTIHFVRKEGTAVVGLLDPYIDPECRCRVTTTFQGSFVTWRTIEGTYSTVSSELTHRPTGGHWKATLLKRL